MKPETKPTPVAIIVRVSTTKQETTRQVSELKALAEGKGWQVVEVCKETISGSATLEDRAGLMRALELAQAGKIKKVVVHEVSRVARRSSVAHSFVEALETCGVSLYWHSRVALLALACRSTGTRVSLYWHSRVALLALAKH